MRVICLLLTLLDFCIDRRGPVISAPTAYLWGHGFKSRPAVRLTCLSTEVYRGFSQSLQANVEVVGLPEIIDHDRFLPHSSQVAIC
jgi:hypothetical protein